MCENLHTLIPIRKSSDLERTIVMVKTKIEDAPLQQSNSNLMTQCLHLVNC